MLGGKTGVVFGVANKYSIAWSIAKVLNHHGARVVFCPASERFRKPIEKLTEDWHQPPLIAPCDLNSMEELEGAKDEVLSHHPQLDFLIHSVAYASPSAMASKFLEVTREDYLQAMSASAFSLLAVSKAFASALLPHSSIAAMSYLGAVRAVNNYGVMGPAKAALEATARGLAMELGDRGIRVNCVSAGPTRTSAARGIPGFTTLKAAAEEKYCIEGEITGDQIADTVAFLVSDLSRSITGQVIYGKGLVAKTSACSAVH